MFSFKLFATLFVLYNVQTSFAGTIKTQQPPEILELLRDVDILSIELESDIDTIALLQKHDMALAKTNTKLTLKQVQATVKAAKGTLCGQVASLQLGTIKEKSEELKTCNEKNLKKLKEELHSYLKGINHEATLISSYCSFISFTTEDFEICVVNAAENLRNRVTEIEGVISQNLLTLQNKSKDCIQGVVTELQLSSIEIEHDLDVCLNPPTEPATEEPTEEPTTVPSHSGETTNENSGETTAENSGENPTEAPNSGETGNSDAPNSGENTEEPNEPATSNEEGGNATEENGNEEGGNATEENGNEEGGNATEENGNEAGNENENGNDNENENNNGNENENGNDEETLNVSAPFAAHSSNEEETGNTNNGEDDEVNVGY